MKVSSIHLINFKRFTDLHIEVRNSLTEDVAEQFLLLGDNGTGKTTVLQAVALCLSLASGQTRSVKDFHWPGWVHGRYERWGMPRVILEVTFTQEEIEATHEVSLRWRDSHEGRHDANYIEPGRSERVRLVLEGDHFTAGRKPSATSPEIQQFRGRWYAGRLLETDPTSRILVGELPGVFWFDQFRTLATPVYPDEANGDMGDSGRVSYDAGVAGLRHFLNRWQLMRLAPLATHRDFLVELESSYQRVFPGHTFAAPEPMYRTGVPSPEDFYFMIDDGEHTYDIEEMSAGEQAVFPMLFEFVRQQIRNSVVLIDEIDLNLHPPLAQAVLSALPALGPGCQFLMTTHSEAISTSFSPHRIYRLPGGRLCL